ncbi:hypothetical protein [Stenotrophomonas oahuensis]|uniref:SMI1/KNR4 family protein n=1 Tax=Stenotrophomonas oahuensis TaxID=3003271 RepID=A0ABY9YSX6_9GAMM|nr:hypothetical protein [Stenotrophomonas sp. A5586]WNH53987.1 hypothetical protein PDM29_06805 [Stenotrophomonas sp. A5586]
MHAEKATPPQSGTTPSSSAGASAPAPCGPPHEVLLSLQGGALLLADCRPGSHDLTAAQLTRNLGELLEQGFLEGEDTGPVQRQVSTAWQADGVEPGLVNLALRPGVVVFGFLDCQGVGDCYFAFCGSEYFSICIESGMTSGGPYDIFVSSAKSWLELKAELENYRHML